MPAIRIYRARIDIGDKISGLVFSYDPIEAIDVQTSQTPIRTWQVDRFYIETPAGYDLHEIDGVKYVRDPQAGDNAYMRAARLVSRVWQNDAGFRIIPSTHYASLDQQTSS